MRKTILLTRSQEDNKILTKIFNQKGYYCQNLPLISSVNLFEEVIIPRKYQNIIVTSKRAANLIAKNQEEIKNAWVVGASSALILQSKNYNVKYIASSASELSAILPDDIYESAIYLSGNFVTIEMPKEIKRQEVYKVSYKENLTRNEINIIKTSPEYIFIYSKNCAKTLVKLIMEANLLKYLENTVIIVISSNIAMVVEKYFKNTVICSGTHGILEKLEEYDRRL